jgi:hypothetical protein
MSNNKQQTAVEFIPYDIALELKQLGFDDEVIATYPKNRRELKLNNVKVTETTKAILFQQAFRWFREKYNLYSNILSWREVIGSDWSFYHKFEIYSLTSSHSTGDEYSTYEEAELACLKKLIEIVKGGNK